MAYSIYTITHRPSISVASLLPLDGNYATLMKSTRRRLSVASLVQTCSNDATLMSKGLGKIEREILAVLRQSPRAFPVDLAITLFKIEIDDPFGHERNLLVTDAQASAVRRALRSLQRKGLVECTDRHNQRGRRWWSLASTPVGGKP
jgi:hypothetical protein